MATVGTPHELATAFFKTRALRDRARQQRDDAHERLNVASERHEAVRAQLQELATDECPSLVIPMSEHTGLLIERVPNSWISKGYDVHVKEIPIRGR